MLYEVVVSRISPVYYNLGVIFCSVGYHLYSLTKIIAEIWALGNLVQWSILVAKQWGWSFRYVMLMCQKQRWWTGRKFVLFTLLFNSTTPDCFIYNLWSLASANIDSTDMIWSNFFFFTPVIWLIWYKEVFSGEVKSQFMSGQVNNASSVKAS